MNKTDVSKLSSKGEMARSKSLTPAVLGVTRPHGIKLSLMTSEGKKEFLQNLEEWRKARKEKLAARILAKQKTIEKPKPPINFVLPKPKSVIPPCATPKSQDRENVFERLYKSNGKFKKSEASETSSKITQAQSIKKNVPISAIRPLKVSEINTLPNEISKARVNDFVAGENSNDAISVSDGSEGRTQMTFEQSPKATDSTIEKGFEFAEPKPLELEPAKSKSTVAKKIEISKTSKFTNATCKNLPPKPQLRRSLSMLFRQKSKPKNVIRKSYSVKDIHELQKSMRAPIEDKEWNSKSRQTAKSVTFCTPKTKQLSSANLKSKLEDWLKMNGHSLEGYRHLRCFEIDNSATALRPPPSAPSNLNNPESVSTTPDSPSKESNKENVTPPTVIPQVDVTQVENWLKELHALITKMKYPSDRCEEWLAAIRKKYPKCSQLPIYWECRAALNESKGDMKSAIEDYERVIIKGGQVESVGNSLAQLFDKMVIEQKKPKSKIEKGIDPKNIFKSTIIKFALQQKTLKKLGPQMAPDIREQLYVATPVRRSSRIQTPLKSKEVDSLETLTPDVKRNLTFKLNESLLEAD